MTKANEALYQVGPIRLVGLGEAAGWVEELSVQMFGTGRARKVGLGWVVESDFRGEM